MLEAMTGGGGRRKRKMNMNKGAESSCGTEEKLCSISTPSATTSGVAAPTTTGPHSSEIAEKPSKPDEVTPLPPPLQNSISSLDFFAQARKALCLRSPFDSDESPSQGTGSATSISASATVPSSTILPSGLAQFLLKNSDSGKRHKRSHSGAEHKGRPEKSRGPNIWVETEEYFRELTEEDIDKLHRVSSLGVSSSDDCFRIPALDDVDSACSMCNVGTLSIPVNGNVANGGGWNGVVDLEAGRAAVQEKEEEDMEEGVEEENNRQFMDVDGVGANEVVKEPKGGEKGIKEEKDGLHFSGLEWLLGSRSKIYLTSERPSKKRKLLGGEAGLEKLLVTRPAEGSTSLCHYCSTGNKADPLNRLIVCSSCGVVVHQRCYGVQNNLDGPWVCSWCKQKNDGQCVEKPCLLCPKQGGALKPAQKRENDEPKVDYAHLFCSQWMPEVYVENTRTMEPIMNADGIKNTRMKLVCYLCKVKCGACVRCSNGACRTSFHPICAREASHRMEIWGRLGCDEVELRAFCSKHSETENGTCQWTGETSVSSDIKHQLVNPLLEKPHKVKNCRKNGDKMTINVERALNCDELNDSKLREDGFLERDTAECADASDSLNFGTILKKLIDQGKISLKDVAAELGISLDSLSSVLNGSRMAPELQKKIDMWLTDHGYDGGFQKSPEVNIKYTMSPKAEVRMDIEFDLSAVTAAESDISKVVPVKSVLPQRRTKSDTRILKSDEYLSPSKEMITGNVEMDEAKSNIANGEGCSSTEYTDGIDKNLSKACEDVLATNYLKTQGESLKVIPPGLSENVHSTEVAISGQNLTVNRPNLPVILPQMPDLSKSTTSSSYVHPLIQHELIKIDTGYDNDGSRDRQMSQLGASSSSGVCCNHHCRQLSTDLVSKFCGSNLGLLVKARNMGLLDLSPADEVKGEIIFYQHRLLSNAVARKLLLNDLISRVAISLQQEIDSARKQKWDAVLLSQYLYELREAKKQGRKERRHKEAQAILAAATAVAAASSRMSVFRKDSLDVSASVEDLSIGNTSNGRAELYLRQNPGVKETLSRSSGARLSSERDPDSAYMVSDFSVEHPRTCDICRRSETILNPILVCLSCKVAVHLDCYRGVKNSTGPWCCELCEDLLSSRGSGVQTTNSWEKPYFVAECGLCGGTSGAFRKSTDGQWIHAFCAEWVLESTFRRGQANPIEGMEMVSKGGDVCIICCRKQGVCIKCNYGNCQTTFHPSCARGAGFYMNVKSGSGKLQHKAYCGKHSLEQQAKAETQKHGIDELKSLKQVRVGLERLRLLCERIVKREKLKRELVLCSHDILSSNRDAVVLSALARLPLYHPDGSSESVTTSTRGYTDGNKSVSDTVQRSDDISVDSTIAGKRRIKFPMPIDNDQKIDDSSVSQHLVTQKPTNQMSFSGKQIPNRPAVASRNLSGDADKRSRHRKPTETFEKELIMTSDQASMKNQRLPKGFVYVPMRCLSKDKETVPACSREPFQRDG